MLIFARKIRPATPFMCSSYTLPQRPRSEALPLPLAARSCSKDERAGGSCRYDVRYSESGVGSAVRGDARLAAPIMSSSV